MYRALGWLLPPFFMRFSVCVCVCVFVGLFHLIVKLMSILPAFNNQLSSLCVLPWWFSSQDSACNTGDTGNAGWIPGLERSPGGGHGNPLQHSCLESPMDRETWWATVRRVAKSRTRLEQLSLKFGFLKM